jgi:16S rRNA (guanine527-N7)-methyltransferase
MRTSRELLPRRAAEIFGLELSAEELHRIDVFVAQLARWATRINLVAARSEDELIDRHVLDSLALTQLTRSAKVAVDFGSGAGFPGILMAITAPRTRVHLLESRVRRAAFLNHATRAAGLANVTVWAIRGETWCAGEKPELIATRGVRADVAAAFAWPKLAANGQLALMCKSDAKAVDCAGYEQLRALQYRLPGGDQHSVLVLRRLERD